MKLAEFTVTYLEFYPIKKKVTKRNFQSQEMFKQTQQVRPNCIIQDLLDFFQSTITITKTF